MEACFLWEMCRAFQRGSCCKCEVGHLLQAVRPSANLRGGDGLWCWVLLSSGHSSVSLRGFRLDSEDCFFPGALIPFTGGLAQNAHTLQGPTRKV